MKKEYRKSQHPTTKQSLSRLDVVLYIGCRACMALFFLFFTASTCPGWTPGESLGFFPSPLQDQYAFVSMDDIVLDDTTQYEASGYGYNGYDSFSSSM
ncbi:MAG: hypothetical protein Q4G59_12330, partial [Planctomycetia bacterium]|nr:hypothetical protein [Planctomycetia bacterium]